jgi:hypothetical protein
LRSAQASKSRSFIVDLLEACFVSGRMNLLGRKADSNIEVTGKKGMERPIKKSENEEDRGG